MGKFKEFLINEQMGLGDLGSRIDSLFHSQWLGNAVNGAIVSTGWTGSYAGGTEQTDVEGFAGHPQNFPPKDLTIPSVERTGRITCLLTKKNPIYVRLSDGTEAHFSYDEYRKIDGEPALGKVMTIIFQRHPQDWTDQHSKIDHVIVRD